MIECPRCYDKNSDFAPFCKECGHDLPIEKHHKVDMSESSELLVSLNELVDTIRYLQYGAEALDNKCPTSIHKGAGDAYEDCADKLTELLKKY